MELISSFKISGSVHTGTSYQVNLSQPVHEFISFFSLSLLPTRLLWWVLRCVCLCVYWPVLMCWLCWLSCPCWLCWLAFGCMAPWGWAGCCGASGGVGCWTWGCVWAVPWGGMTPVAVKNWLMEEHRSAIWAASNDQLLSSACRMLSFRPESDGQRRQRQNHYFPLK